MAVQGPVISTREPVSRCFFWNHVDSGRSLTKRGPNDTQLQHVIELLTNYPKAVETEPVTWGDTGGPVVMCKGEVHGCTREGNSASWLLWTVGGFQVV